MRASSASPSLRADSASPLINGSSPVTNGLSPLGSGEIKESISNVLSHSSFFRDCFVLYV